MSAFDVVVVITAWVGATVVALTAVLVAVLAVRLRQPVLALFGLLPVGAGILLLLFPVAMPAPPVLPAILALAFAALAVVGGNPLTVWVLDRASKGGVDGTHGGILVAETTADGAAGDATTREVLRGGTWIGYLERIAVVGAIVLGRWEILAAVIAIKGLGRFSELDAPEARERFIIGTLVSMTWAAVCGAIILLGIAPALAA